MTLLAASLFALLFSCMGIAHAESTLDRWRKEIAETRVLTDNDAPRAFAEAKRLQANLPADATPADHARLLNLLSRIEGLLANTAQSSSYARNALDLAKKHGDPVGQVEANMNIALNSISEGNIQDLISSTTHSLEFLNDIDAQPALLGETLLRAAMMYMRIGQIDESVTTCMQAMEIARHSRNPRALTYAHQCVAISFSEVGRINEAHEHYLQMRKEARAARSKLQEAYALIGISVASSKLGDPQQSEMFIREGVNLFREVGASFPLSFGLNNIAIHLYGRGRYSEALVYFNEVLEIFNRHPNKIGSWYTLNSRSETYQAQGDLAAALRDAENAYALAKEINLPRYNSESAQRVASVVAAKGDYRRAYALLMEAGEMVAKAAREKVSARVVELAERYESESKRRQIEELTRRNEQQTAELKQRALEQRWLWTVLGGSFLMLGGIVFFLLRLRRSHRTIRNLNASLEQRVQTRTSELRQQARYLRTLIDALPWWVWLKDVQGCYLAVNQAAADPCGLSAVDMLGKSDFEVRPPELADAFVADDLEVMAARSSKSVEEMQVVAGRQVWLEIFKAPVLDEDGTVLGTVGFARDISERKAVEAAREAALAEAQRLARLRSEFLAQMSHELRTPLNGILGYAQILRRDPTLMQRQAAGVAVIQQSGEHLLTLINDTLDMAKIEAGKLELYPVDIAMPRFLHDIAEMVRIKAEQKNVEFVCELAPDLPATIRTDEKRLRQALLNLLANAVKFTEYGQVRLCVGTMPSGQLRFEVFDTGIGIRADQLDAIFSPFEQAGDAQYRLGGTGLGLTISRQFVRLMGGDIHVESRVGEGSRFWFELDLPPAASDAVIGIGATASTVRGYEGTRKTVLVVDDVVENRAVAVDMLSQLGFTMAEAVNGKEALEKAQALKPDLILMDVILPEMDGMATTRRLRELPDMREVPIIAVSASAFVDDERRCLAAGMNAFLPKPIELDRLLAQMASLLKLTWIHEAPQAAAPASPAADGPLFAPPPDEMDILYDLARRGYMQDIQKRADYLFHLDTRFQPFAEQLRRLASRYQSKAVTSFIEQHMGEARSA